MERFQPIRLQPIYRERIWGGSRLQPEAHRPIGEAWVVYEGNRVLDGPFANRTLSDVAMELGPDLLGAASVAQTGHRFPLLIKLLDSREWLSVQVHPNDEQAARLEGPDCMGKTEAWHILEADAGSMVVFGVCGEPTSDELKSLATSGRFEDALNYVPVNAGDTLFTPAGCVHAIGPGLFIYEVQQTSDITYRLYDWNRPMEAGRELHLEKGFEVVGTFSGQGSRTEFPERSARAVLAACAYFDLEVVRGNDQTVRLDTQRRSFHALTVTSGEVEVHVAGSAETLSTLESAVIPAGAGAYDLHPVQPFQLLLSKVP